MAGETSIDTGLNVGEAQVFRPYNDQGLTGQAAIGIEQDKIARKKAADDELKKKLAGSNLDMKGDGLPPALSPVWVKKYTELNKNIQQGILSGKENDIDFKNLTSRDIANVAQFVPDGKSMAVTLHELSKLNIAGELDPESQDSFNKLNDANYWSKRESEGASLPEIAGEYSALLQSVKKKPEVVDWTKELKLGTKGTTKEVGRENEKTGFKTLTSTLDEKKAMSEAKGRWEAIGPEKQLRYLAEFGVTNSEQAIQNIYNNIVASTDTKDIQSYDRSAGPGDISLGSGAVRKGDLIIRLTGVDSKGQELGSNTELTKQLGMDYVPAKGRRSIAFTWDDKDKMNAPVKMNSDATKKVQILGVPVGLEENENGDWEYILSVKNAGAKEGSRNEFRKENVPYIGNETHVNELEGFESPDKMYDYALKSMQEGVSTQTDNTPKATNTLNYFKDKK